MALPYGIDYLKNTVDTALNSNEPKDTSSDGVENTPEESGGQSMYGVPPAMTQEAQGMQEMGPRFKALVDAYHQSPISGAVNSMAGSPIARAAAPYGPVAGAAASGSTQAFPPMQALQSAIAGASKMAGGKRNDFTDAGPPSGLPEYVARLGHFESGNNPLAYNKSSGASGLHQYLDSTWNNYGGFKSAKDAPPQVQLQRAMEDTVDRLKHNDGDLVKATLTHFLGAKGLQRVLANPQKLYEPVNAANHDTTPFSYGAGILGKQVMQDWATNHHSDVGMNTGAQTMPYNLPANGLATVTPQG